MSRFYTFSLVLFFVIIGFSSNAQTVTCSVDTLKYTYSKSSNFDTLSLNPILTSAVYQYYEAPQDITISGVKFYGFKTDSFDVFGDFSDSMEVIVEIRNATLDSVPGNNLLASDTIRIGYVDTTDTVYSFNFYSNVALFDSSITTANPYTVVIRTENDSNFFSFFHNEYDELLGGGDGNQEWLSGAFQGSGWVKSNVFSPNPNGIAFDADFFIEPIVTYTLTASFINDPECLFNELGDTVEFFNDASIIVDHRMYNRYPFFNQPGAQTWNYGDGSPVEQVSDPLHFYPTNGPFAATLTARIFSWSQLNCQSSRTQIIDEKPEQGFSFVTSNLDVDFTNETPASSLFSNIFYDFGDGNTSQSENPSHKYSQPGTYWVCQTMLTSCGEITECRNVAVATNTALNCGKDSVRFTSARGTDTRTLTIRSPLGPQRLVGVGQRFTAPQSIIVHGFTFYANHTGLYRDSYEVIGEIWYEGAGNVPDTATGPLASSSVRINKYDVDTNYSEQIKYTAIFNEPVNLLPGDDYVLTIEYFGDIPLMISTTDWEEGDGDQDLLAVGQVVAGNDTFWVTPASVSLFNAGGLPFDADVIIEPLVEYNFNANFSYGFECLTFNSAGERIVQFTNQSSPIASSTMYNAGVFYNSTLSAYEWDFGDSTAISNFVNAEHLFVAPGPFNVELTIIMDGWTNDCQSSQTYNVPVAPTGGFSYEQVTSTVKFIDESHNADEYWWTFSDSTYSSLSDPRHFFLRLGEFEVCQYVSNVCGSDTTCEIITINVLGIPEDFMQDMSIYPNPTSDVLHIDADLTQMKSLELTLYDFSGRIVKSIIYNESIVNESIYVGDLAKGAYIMDVKAGEYKGTQKLIIN